MNLRRGDDERNDHGPGGEGRGGPSAALILSGVLVVLAVIFAVQNGDDVSVNLLWIDATMRLWVVIVVSLVLGALIDRLVSIWRRRSREH